MLARLKSARAAGINSPSAESASRAVVPMRSASSVRPSIVRGASEATRARAASSASPCWSASSAAESASAIDSSAHPAAASAIAVARDARISARGTLSDCATSMRAFPTETADAGSRAASASTSSPSESMTRSGSAHCASISRRASGCAVIQASRVMIGEVDKLVYSIVSGRSAIASPPQITRCQ